MDEQRVQTYEVREVNYKATDIIIFIAGLAGVLLLLKFDDRFFWLALPFMFTYLVKSLKMM